MKMNNRFIYGILSIALAAIIAFIAIPVITKKASTTTKVVCVSKDIPRGSLITGNDVNLVEVGGYNLPENIATDIEDVIGTYAAVPLLRNDYVLSSKVSSQPLSSDLTLNEIPNGMVAISISTQTLATGLSDKLQSNDIIRIYYYNKDNPITPVEDIPELRFLKVICVTDTNGLEIDYTTPPADDAEPQQTATLTVLATPEQAILLTRYEYEGVLHVALISRGNEKLAKELLSRQSDVLLQRYGNGSDANWITESTDINSSMSPRNENLTDSIVPSKK